MTGRLAIAFALVLVSATLAPAQDRRRTELIDHLRAQAERYRVSDLDAREFMLRSAWQDSRLDRRHRELCRELAAESELLAAVAATEDDPFAPPAAAETIEDLLAGAADGPRLARTARYFRFLTAYERLDPVARAKLPDVPWVRAQRELASRESALRDLLPRLAPLRLENVARLDRVLALTGSWYVSGNEYHFGQVVGWLLPGGTPERFTVLIGLEPAAFAATGAPLQLPRELAGREGGALPRYELRSYEAELVRRIAAGPDLDVVTPDGLDRLGLRSSIRTLVPLAGRSSVVSMAWRSASSTSRARTSPTSARSATMVELTARSPTTSSWSWATPAGGSPSWSSVAASLAPTSSAASTWSCVRSRATTRSARRSAACVMRCSRR